MKKLILFLLLFFIYLGMNAQDSTTDYIYSPDGFEVKTGVITRLNSQGATIIHRSEGLYSKDGKVFVAAIAGDNYSFYVIDGCETIVSGAFDHLARFRSDVYIPSTVKYIAPGAFNYIAEGTSRCFFYGICDGVVDENISAEVEIPSKDSNSTEVARYNVKGVRLSEPSSGINIVQYSDGTADKVLVE